MKKLVINKGDVFGKLTVIGESPPQVWFSSKGKKHTYRTFNCRCVCGNELVVLLRTLRKTHRIRSCGCLGSRTTCGDRARTHGMRGRAEYRIWAAMKSRCNNKNTLHYSSYGGRGIKVCDDWQDSFEAFYQDMGDKPSRNHSIDRIDNDMGYTPDNCRWATNQEQASNRRVRADSVYFTVGPIRDTQANWTKFLNVSTSRLYMRRKAHPEWTDEQIILGKRLA